MGSTRMWLLLLAAQVVVLLLLAAAGPVTAATPALRYLGYACLAGIFACIPPLVVKLFVAAQVRVGNGAHPMVRGLQQHEAAVIVVAWVMIVAALIMALPTIMRDIREEQQVAAAADSQMAALRATVAADTVPASGASADEGADMPVSTPAPGSPERTAILDALRQRLRTQNRFRVDHIRTAGEWAFVRATEVVALDDSEEQETDLTVAALLELPARSATGWWRIVELWTLPGEESRPLADFAGRVRERQRTHRLPDALFPDDLWTR